MKNKCKFNASEGVRGLRTGRTFGESRKDNNEQHDEAFPSVDSRRALPLSLMSVKQKSERIKHVNANIMRWNF